MAKSNAVTLAEIQLTLKGIEQDITELKQNSVSREAYDNLNDRLKKMEENQSKMIWAIVLAVAGAVLNSVIKGL